MTAKWAWVGAAIAAIGIAYLLVDRLDSQSLAFIAGAVCGVAGSIPAAVLFFWLHERQAPLPRPQEARERPPQVVMMPQAQQQYLAATQPSFTAPAVARPKREFTIVGEEDTEDGTTETN